MASIEHLFELETPYEDEKEEFLKIMNREVEALFSNVGNIRYKVPHLASRSVINKGRAGYKGAKYRSIIMQFSSFIRYQQKNTQYQNMHQSLIYDMIHQQAGGSFVRLMNTMEKVLNQWYDADLQFNVVKYAGEDVRKMATEAQGELYFK